MEAITLDNIYKLMLNFGKLYDIISDEEKKSLITYLIKEIQIYPNGESEMDWMIIGNTQLHVGRGGRTFLNPIAAKNIYYIDIYNIYTKIANKEFEKPLPPLPCGRIHHH